MSRPLISNAGFSTVAGVSLTNSAQTVALTKDTTNYPRSHNVPRFGELRSIEVKCSSIAAGAAQVTCHLCRDSGADEPVMAPITAAIQTGATTATDGTAVLNLSELEWNWQAGSGNEGTIYLNIELDAGTATADIYLNWRTTAGALVY